MHNHPCADPPAWGASACFAVVIVCHLLTTCTCNPLKPPCRVQDCFEKDEMARITGSTLNISFLAEGVAPEVDMNLYLQVCDRQTPVGGPMVLSSSALGITTISTASPRLDATSVQMCTALKPCRLGPVLELLAKRCT